MSVRDRLQVEGMQGISPEVLALLHSVMQEKSTPAVQTTDTWGQRLTRKFNALLPMYDTVLSIRVVESRVLRTVMRLLSEPLLRCCMKRVSSKAHVSVLRLFNGMRVSRVPGPSDLGRKMKFRRMLQCNV